LSRRIPDLEELFQAADDHAEAAGHFDYAIGDLQEILRAAWRVLTPKQRLKVFSQPEMTDLAEIPEYESLLGDMRDSSQ
jgi:hypothetical protein